MSKVEIKCELFSFFVRDFIWIWLWDKIHRFSTHTKKQQQMATCGDKRNVLSTVSDFESMAFFALSPPHTLTHTNYIQQNIQCTAYRLHESLLLLHGICVPLYTQTPLKNKRQKSTMSLLCDSVGSQSNNIQVFCCCCRCRCCWYTGEYYSIIFTTSHSPHCIKCNVIFILLSKLSATTFETNA